MTALAASLGIQRLIVAGYSMGGMVAQLLYRRHPPLADHRSGPVCHCTRHARDGRRQSGRARATDAGCRDALTSCNA
jgi:pimeloyl-ACP methyl ester carboxylesterase